MGVRPLTSGKKAVFLDRDGVVNQAILKGGKPYPPANVSELIINPDATSSLPQLRQAGYLLIVVTNQPDVARGTTPATTIHEIHDELRSKLPIDDFFVCYHDDADRCGCRKPLPGLMLDAASRHSIDLADSFLIGDRWRDIDAGHAAGVRTVLIDYGYKERGPDHEPGTRVKSLKE